ncbi:hypothetical protein [Mycoplana sp. MJR14]|uniref:HNH endonuclease n=1 Tax=Mycoplana sp. MJR14 TaxID=3032583 RepID=UPI0023DC4250|nr:hypothetical protein [Mycoplana sp. MJR14]MDF1635583.1 hypothetical protein [Mycoplana sp. MJR14]
MDALTTFDTCRAGVQDPGLRGRLLAARPHIGAAEATFDAEASAGTDHLIATATHVGAVSSAEMETLYTRHMARGNSRGRHIYDELMMAAVNDMCPFCGHRSVSTLDHTLPKAQHPALAVTPINLVPCCKDCNHGKGTAFSAEAAEQWLNAYYDDISADRWLYAEIVEGAPPVAIFFVHAPDNWDAVTAARVQNQFEKLNLAKLYASQAARQFQNARRALREIHHSAGPEGVREDLNRRYLSFTEVMVNSWEAALYQAASISDWYCDGGFAL